MPAFTVVAHRSTRTNNRLAPRLTPAQALIRLRPGDVAVGRLDVLRSLDGIEPGLWALERLAATGITVLNQRRALLAAHDKLATAEALAASGVPHPPTVHIAPSASVPELTLPLVLKPRFGAWGMDVIRCETLGELQRALSLLRTRP